MLYLSELLGMPVYDAAGKKLGRVAELGAHLAAHPPRVAHFRSSFTAFDDFAAREKPSFAIGMQSSLHKNKEAFACTDTRAVFARPWSARPPRSVLLRA